MSKRAIATRSTKLRPTTINLVLAEVRELQRQGKELVSLMRGQPDFATPAKVVEAAQNALRAGRTGYADNQGEPALREAVAAKIERDQGVNYDPKDEILVTDGATCGVSTALAALVEPGVDVVVPSPIYDAYASAIALWGGRAAPVDATIRDGRFTVNRDAFEKAWTPNARVLLLNTPWNPVGTVLGRDELEAILAFAREKDLWVISDEIYESLIYDDRRHVSPASLSDDARCRTIIVNSLSKTYAMTGWRIGYCAGPAELIWSMLLTLQQFSRGPATFVQDAAIAALQADQSCIRDITAECQRRRDRVVKRLRGVRHVEAMTPEGGLFVMLDVRGLQRPSDEIRRQLLHDSGVIVVHGSAFGEAGEGTLRVSFASGQTLEPGLDRLASGLQRLSTT